MKQLTIVLTAVLLLVAAALAEERATVFRGLAWGDPPEALERFGRVEMTDSQFFSYIRRDGVDVECLRSDGPVLRCYQSNPEPLGSVRVDAIYFTFWRNELMHIRVTTYGAKVIEDRFYALLEARYGLPTVGSISRLYEPIRWDLGDTIVELERETVGGRAIRAFSLWSPKRVAEHNAWVREQRKAEAEAAW